MDRRSAIKLGVAASAAGILGISSNAEGAASTATPNVSGVAPGYVVKVHKSGMRGRFYPDPRAAEEMVDKAVCTLTGETDLKKAWARFIKPEDRVGIKINALAGRFASTMKEVVDPIVKGVRLVGVPDENILIYDQYGGNMRAARFEWQDKPGKLRVMNHAVLGYENSLTESAGGGRGKLAKTLLWTTAVINVPVLKDHDLAGVTCAIKNMVCGSVEKPPLMHRKIHTALPNFYALDHIRGRVRLTICDGSFCLYDGGPKYNPGNIVSHDSVYATVDPAAMDATALAVVDSEREKHGFKPLEKANRPATFLKVAEDIGLGISDRAKIRLETVALPPVVRPDKT